ncbi:phage baseplate assembly protein [Yersinia kristensenii]|uniref:Putative bacteriophage tail protein n=1 Tax=Yersinia kristensenii TaxID=28152 RepID=A0A0T9LN66_YERKR|nr:contractile injection system protein, VgrG/Pvc8 family [Yersinia kristensenii]MDA5471947.1 contractile injection system protein, VgrG/Pvc8 family [Yersinia kristensenii]MDA5475227.1 contractile injection system protein, VgrG/Pvc8 family [Yersinia kristensenii]MDA5507299.1 contractile injection system protein, VgrG/Pvc8 family [Yersinia kristensenii]MDA5521220.1 contractile injection system protein, VgrG/Pvc8 family [Yersinia kristensenii]MDR4897970.1 contractile injection system protein, Vg
MNDERVSDDLTLEVGGRAITGWSKIQVTRSIEKLPSSFELSLMDRYPASEWQQWVNPGDACVVKLGNDAVLTGYIDSWDNKISGTTHEVTAKGRSKCQDLVDCSAEWPNSVISQSTVLQIAQKLAEPYGINVTSDITDMAVVPKFTLNWGETAQAVIEHVTRWAALLYYDQPDGNLYLTRVGQRKAASGVEQGVNILSANLHTDINQRFIDYTGVALSNNAMARRPASGGNNISALVRTQDTELAQQLPNRHRNKIIIVESTMNSENLVRNSLDWSINRNNGRSKMLSVQVDHWRDRNNQLWETNSLIPITIPSMGLKNELWLLSSVTYLKDANGTVANMTLMPPEAFAVQPYKIK